MSNLIELKYSLEILKFVNNFEQFKYFHYLKTFEMNLMNFFFGSLKVLISYEDLTTLSLLH